MKKLHVKATFIEPVLGTWPANPNVARSKMEAALEELIKERKTKA